MSVLRIDPGSIKFRIIAATALWALLVLPLAGWTLNSIYRDKVEQEFDRRLDQLMTLLLASTRLDEGERPVAPDDFGGPLFSLPIKNGWYWQIEPVEPRGNWRLMSESLLGEPLADPRIAPESPQALSAAPFDLDLPDGQRLRAIQRPVQTEVAGIARRFLYLVTGNRREVDQDVAYFANRIALSLGALGVGLVALTLVLVGYGLHPLDRVKAGLARIRSGEATRLEGELPSEIQPLQIELNALIQSNQEVVERARTHVGNLAHALKTPLSVIANEASREQSPLACKVHEQAGIMRDQVNHYLDRARMAARVGVISAMTPVRPTALAIARTLERINSERAIAIDVDCPDGLSFRGERQDLEELLGNLVDNACKWARSRVEVRVSRQAQASPGHRPMLVIDIDDDGPGLSVAQREAAMKRGQRLDESKPGSGLGLSIVRDLTGLYQGRFRLADAPLGGLRARLELPEAV
ncbi:MAG: histidine kinase [Rhizobiales bacterium]|nr:histidine kinase [Hyphomicrobiales bacterium]